MAVQNQEQTMQMPLPLRSQLSQRLRDLHLRLDEAWLTGVDQVRIQADIETVERDYASLFCPCHLCARPTIFRDAAYELPFCWTCLNDNYHRWYRSVRYNRS